MTIAEHIQALPQEKAAAILVSVGGGGSFAQALTEWSNSIVAGGNIVLILGGLYLMYHKVMEVRTGKKGKKNA
jgi:uncharacterized protein (UPF0248 family)